MIASMFPPLTHQQILSKVLAKRYKTQYLLRVRNIGEPSLSLGFTGVSHVSLHR